MPYEDPRKLSKEERIINPYHHIDPGFINPRLCFSTFGPKFHELYEKQRKKETDHMSRLYNDHLLVDMVLTVANKWGIPPLAEVLQNPAPKKGFCSTEKSLGAGDFVYQKGKRAESEIALPFEYEKKVVLSFGTEHFVADTGKLEMSDEHSVAIVGIVRSITDTRIVLYPMIIGAPSFDHPYNKDIGVNQGDLMWGGWDLYQLVPEDIDEFKKLIEIHELEEDEWKATMRSISEDNIKQKICEILGDVSKKDWGGETNDHFTTNIQVGGKRKSAAFLFKGPANFSEMKVTHLGKNGDQLVRLTHTPADILIVQHCHLISEPVRELLRALAVQPSNPRHYCFLDGKDTFRLLKAYGKI